MDIQTLKALVNERLNAAAEEIFGAFENTVIKYEEEIVRQRRLLDIISKPEVKLCRADAAVQHFVWKEEVSSEQQERSPRLGQEDPKPPQIKEEQEELTARRGHGVEQLQGMEEVDITKFTHSLTFTPVPVKSGNDDEEKPQSSQLNQTQIEEDGTGDPLPSTSAAQMKTEPDGEYAWLLSSDCSGTGTDDGGEWEESGGTQSGLNTVKSKEMKKGQRYSIKMFKKAVEHIDPTENFQLHVQAHRRTCNVCGERCTCNLDFQRHLNISHTREKPFSCTVCGKQFGKKGNLNVHMRTHTGEKPFGCPYCGNSFRTTTALKEHMRTHTGEKPFGCPFCGKRCRHSSTLRIHMRIHTGEKPFGCTTCGKRFSESRVLRKHMKVHTGGKTIQWQCL